ncbi:MAG TPA: FAD-binding and (Fe-S)-binding domain-containing protein [Rhodanobacteraceae bacterium]|nr:FAD-binding and (Fe-S)-binding domain-containing protein [Rhodanobacteraceae bacterium]
MSNAYALADERVPAGAREVDGHALAAALAREVAGEVRFDAGDRALYANDASVYRQVPIGVVIPKSVDDVLATVALCREHGAPIFARGCGTGLAGQSVNTAVLIDFSKYMNRILELDPERRYAWVEPGLILDTLREEAEKHQLTFGPDPATHTRCTLGGMIGNNSCGVHSILSGVTADNIEALDVLLYDGTRMTLPCEVSPEDMETVIAGGGRCGEIYAKLKALGERYADAIRSRYPQIPRRISGYNLNRLLPEHHFNLAAALVGTEATCALTLRAKCKLVPSPQCRVLVMIGYEDGYTDADRASGLRDYQPIGLEMFDRRLVQNELEKGFQRHTELLPEGDGWLLVEFGAASKDQARTQAQRMLDDIKGGDQLGVKCFDGAEEQEEIWTLREGGVGHSKVVGEHPGWPSFEDAAVAPEKIGDFLRDFERLINDHGRRISALFGHVGAGCVHTRIDWDLRTREGIANYRRTMEDAADLVVRYGGSLSGEHGDGQARGELLERMYGPELIQAFREFKAIWDPDGRMNPGKVSDPYPLDSNLRMPLTHRMPPLNTQFQFPDDDGSFAFATQRCFGVGKCRRLGGGTMCPSFMATREERYSTRGRARLLFEMMDGDMIRDGWRSEEVKDALDLCLACKGCKHDCPVQVDMATYKAEFLSHYYRGRMRPLSAYLFGLIPWASRIASLIPGISNKVTRTRMFKQVTDVAPERALPGFAEHTFKHWFAHRHRKTHDGSRVVLWPDTFTNFFEPEVGIAAVEVLEAIGYQVELPRGALCCGRPLYDYGMLDLARRQLRQILSRMRHEIRAGVPVIGLEPSCTAVFRDELGNLFPDDDDAGRLTKQTFTFAEFLTQQTDVRLPRLGGKAVVHAHCHHKALFGTQALTTLLDRLGIDHDMPESGCCGMAGSFGYEAGAHHDVSIKAGERVLLPTVHSVPKDTLIIADGFSCRTQIASLTDRRALHPDQVIQIALQDARLAARAYPETDRYAERPTHLGTRDKVALGVGAAVVGGVVLWAVKHRRQTR